MKTVAAQAFVFFAAGFETTSTTLSFCLYELALNPEIQIKAVQEVRNVKEKYGMLSYESTQEMTYVEHIIEGRWTFSKFSTDFHLKNWERKLEI